MSGEASRLITGLPESVSLPEGDLSHIELSPEWRAELLDPGGWRDVLETYARTLNVAVALTDREGRPLAKCHNPQPTWRLAREAKPEVEDACYFCLAPAAPCTAVADAISTGAATMTQDAAGLAHVAVPLCLGDQKLGALIAGQVFNRYPDPLNLQRVSREFGISQQRLWHDAIQELPISRATLRMYANLLMTMGGAFLGQRYAAILHRELVEANRSIRRSLWEKEVLLREIQHRVKNNLQIIASLLSMESNSLDDVNDAKAVQVLKASQQRIAAMARIHDLLYGSEQVGEINLADYVRDLAGMVMSSFQSGVTSIRARFDLTPVPLSIHQAIPCGLIVNELVTNVFKYAYPNQAGGEIGFCVKPTGDGRVSLTISDDGVGMPAGLDWQRSNSLGLRIIRILTGQLDGTLELDTQHGVSFTLQFPYAGHVKDQENRPAE